MHEFFYLLYSVLVGSVVGRACCVWLVRWPPEATSECCLTSKDVALTLNATESSTEGGV